MGLSLSHLLIILVVVLVIFGAGRLPQVMGDLARGLKAFKDGLHKEEETKEELKSKGKKGKERLKK